MTKKATTGINSFSVRGQGRAAEFQAGMYPRGRRKRSSELGRPWPRAARWFGDKNRTGCECVTVLGIFLQKNTLLECLVCADKWAPRIATSTNTRQLVEPVTVENTYNVFSHRKMVFRMYDDQSEL
jgi:hypothetical protein